MALTVTHISAATASLTWALWERIKYGKASLVGGTFERASCGFGSGALNRGKITH